jgi:hypothetical protein
MIHLFHVCLLLRWEACGATRLTCAPAPGSPTSSASSPSLHRQYTRALTFENVWGGCSMLMRFVWEKARSKEARNTEEILKSLCPSLISYTNQARTLTFQNFWQDLLDFLLALHSHTPILLPGVVEGLLPHGPQVCVHVCACVCLCVYTKFL